MGRDPVSATPPLISHTPSSVQTAYGALDKREKRFVRAYVQTLNASRAIVEAGYKGSHPNVKGYKLLQRADVKAAVEEYERFYLAELGVRAVAVMRETLAIGTSDPRRLVWQAWEDIPVWTAETLPRYSGRFDEVLPVGKSVGDIMSGFEDAIGKPRARVGDRKALHELDNDTASALAGVDVEEVSKDGYFGQRFKYKLWDKNKALDKLGQYTKLWDAKGNVTNVDARTINASTTSVHVGGPAAVSAAVQLLERLNAIGAGDAAALCDPNGSVLPAAVCPQPAGRGTSVDAPADQGSPGKP
jgi:hypothetical protein